MQYFTAKDVLTALFNKNGLGEADGRMLCKYRCDDGDYSRLQVVLKECIALRHRAMPRTDIYEVAAFCLYASEWWRRNYDSGPWKWSIILESIGLDHNYSRIALYDPIRLGLRFWERRLLTVGDRNAYFVTLACEGGLPLKLIHRAEDSHLKRYLRALLREFRVYGGQETSSIELAARISSHLPRGLQQKQLFQICGELIEQIWRLQSQLTDSTTPVEDLDRRIPGWREMFPLVVSDDAARALLNSLINDAVKIARVQEIKFATILEKTAVVYQLERKVQLPSYFDAPSLASLLQIPVQNLPYRIHLYQQQLTGKNKLLALVTRRTVGDDGRFAIEIPSQAPTALQGSAAAESVWIDARSASIDQELRNIKGSLKLSDLPWIFASKDGDTQQWELIGQGSLKTKFSEVIIAVSSDAKIEKENAICENLGKNVVLGRHLYRVAGQVTILDNDNRTTLFTKSNEEESAQYMLSGELLSYGTFGSNIFKGLPRLAYCFDSSAMMSIPPELIQWKTRSGTDPWKNNLNECFGPVTIRYVSHGDTRFMADIDVVPAEGRITFIPGTAPRVGSIAVKGMQANDYGTMQAETVQMDRQLLSDGCTFEFSSILEPPATIELYLRWQLGQELTLQAPYPARGVRFINRDGSILRTDEKVHLSRMSGVIIQVMEVNPNVSYSVEATVLSTNTNTSILKHEGIKLHETAPGRHEIDLRLLQEGCDLLFSAVDDLDAWIRVRVISSHGFEFPQKIYIARYDLTLDIDRALGEILIPERELETCGDEIANIELRTFPLTDPTTESELLPKLADNRWHFKPDMRNPGPWLITGWDGDWCRLRPLCWTVPDCSTAETEVDDRLSFDKIVRIPDPQQRSEACDSMLINLVADPDHNDWKNIDAYFNHLRYLPANTFDVITRMAQHPDAAAMTLLRAGEDRFDEVWTGLERLPFAWYLIPVESWLRSTKVYAEHLNKALAPLAESLTEEISTILEGSFKSFFNQAPVRVPGLQPVVELIRYMLFSAPLSQMRYLLMVATKVNRRLLKEICIMEAQQELLHQHAEDHWPASSVLSEQWWPQQQKIIPKELHLFWNEPTGGIAYRSPVLNSPIVAAFAAAFNIKLSQELVFHVRRMREFDTTWFDAAYGCALAASIGYRIENNLEYNS